MYHHFHPMHSRQPTSSAAPTASPLAKQPKRQRGRVSAIALAVSIALLVLASSLECAANSRHPLPASAGSIPGVEPHVSLRLFKRAAAVTGGIAKPKVAPVDLAAPGASNADGDADESQPELIPILDAEKAAPSAEKPVAGVRDGSVEFDTPVEVPVEPVKVSDKGPAGKHRGATLGGASDPPLDRLPTPVPNQTAEEKAADETRRSLITSSLMVIVSEIGDKTFLVAAILAMTHPRLVVFIAAWSALAVMSVLSALLGNVLPTLLNRTYTQALAGVLFLVFGFRMVQEGRGMEPDAGTDEEMAEVAAEIKARDKYEYERLERGTAEPEATTSWAKLVAGTKKVAAYILSPIFVETFVLTFLAEWGDRSQIATIAMAAAGNVMSVILGTIAGHSLCTGLAVMGGKMLATRISVRTVTLVGGVTFLAFGVLTFVYLE
ncbi:hypothetical protein BCR44DRAFT_1425937 [Catenaria anguillulae PL171]|uniref:GDT1 family protein n=1 Tax=Catenaria anguillulae PL171 TaxID=765915 RepID=A0A1Y2I1V1_9FUNG|nr:hypothetical protein BCR44DRAFT_1425937 [Catenaria anguillulae PL171]